MYNLPIFNGWNSPENAEIHRPTGPHRRSHGCASCPRAADFGPAPRRAPTSAAAVWPEPGRIGHRQRWPPGDGDGWGKGHGDEAENLGKPLENPWKTPGKPCDKTYDLWICENPSRKQKLWNLRKSYGNLMTSCSVDGKRPANFRLYSIFHVFLN